MILLLCSIIFGHVNTAGTRKTDCHPDLEFFKVLIIRISNFWFQLMPIAINIYRQISVKNQLTKILQVMIETSLGLTVSTLNCLSVSLLVDLDSNLPRDRDFKLFHFLI